MKLNKKVLVSTLAVAGAVLGTLAPTAATFAATSTIANLDGSGNAVLDDSGNAIVDVTKTTLQARPEGSTGDALMGAEAQSTKGVGSATADSEAYVNVKSGVLTLDAVPDFNFGDAAPDSTVNLYNNDSIQNNDGNSGYLQITDARSASQNPNQYEGYTLQLQVNPFAQASGTTTAYTASTDDASNVKPGNEFKLLFDASLNTSAFDNDQTANPTMVGTSFTSTGDAANFLDADTSYGRTRMDLSSNNGDSIHLQVPKDVSDGQYVSHLVWTLTPHAATTTTTTTTTP